MHFTGGTVYIYLCTVQWHYPGSLQLHSLQSHPLGMASKFSRWLTFLNERAPPLVFALLGGGPVVSSLYLYNDRFDWLKFLTVFPAQLLLLLTIRIMDDVKDYDKDVKVHPDRPLPRGLLTIDEVVRMIRNVIIGEYAYAFLLAFIYNRTVAILYAIQITYGVLMYYEFGIGEELDKSPFLYALSHQLSLYCGAFTLAAVNGVSEPYFSYKTWMFGCVGFSGFFTFDICRKLDPELPLLKGTYLVVYGKLTTFFMIAFTVGVGVVGSYGVDAAWLCWPFEFGFLALVGAHFFVPMKKGGKRYKIIEGLAVLFVLFHMWSGTIAGVWK